MFGATTTATTGAAFEELGVAILAVGTALPAISGIMVLVKLRCVTELLILKIWVFFLDLCVPYMDKF